MKQPVDETISRWKHKLMKQLVHENTSWWNVWLGKWLVDETTSQWKQKLMKSLVDEMTGWWKSRHPHFRWNEMIFFFFWNNHLICPIRCGCQIFFSNWIQPKKCQNLQYFPSCNLQSWLISCSACHLKAFRGYSSICVPVKNL